MEDLPFHCSHCLSTGGLGPQKPLSAASSKVCSGLAERCQNQPSTIREGKPDKVSFGVSAGKTQGLPWWLSGKESTCQCRRPGFDPWAKKIPWRRKWQLTPVFLPGKFHRQRSLVGYSPLGHKSQIWLSNKGKPTSMVGEHGSSPPVAKSSSKQISHEDWGTCKKVSPRCTPAGLQKLQALLVPLIEHGEEHPVWEHGGCPFTLLTASWGWRGDCWPVGTWTQTMVLLLAQRWLTARVAQDYRV